MSAFSFRECVESFETHAQTRGLSLELAHKPDVRYWDDTTEEAWRAWIAAAKEYVNA